MNSINIKSYFTLIGGGIAIFVVMLLLAVRLLNIASMLHQQEREHLREVVEIISLVERGKQMRMFSEVEKNNLIEATSNASFISSFPDREFFTVERWILKAIGFEKPLSLATLSSIEARDFAIFEQTLPVKSFLSGRDITTLEERSNKLLKHSDDFSPLITSAVKTLKAVSFSIIGLAVFSIPFIFYILFRNIVTPLEQLGKNATRLGKGDLRTSHTEPQRFIISDFNNLQDQLESARSGLINIVDDLRNARNELGESINKTNESVNVIASNISQQHLEADSVSTAAEEVTASAAEVSNITNHASDQANDATKLAKQGSKSVLDAIQSSDEAADKVAELITSLEVVDVNTSTIKGVLDIISGITEQTELLALNAAIEAARAGELGRGFSVVADEVKQLAKSTRKSTATIEGMIDELCKSTQEAAQKALDCRQHSEASRSLASNAGEFLNEITHKIVTIASTNTQIATATSEQRSTSDEINLNIHGIVEKMENTTKISQEIINNINELTMIDNNISLIIGRFTLSSSATKTSTRKLLIEQA